MLHIVLHLLVPALVTVVFFRKVWRFAFVVMVATMIVDVDHIFSNPIYDPGRCSIGFHPLHQVWLMVVYIALCLLPKTRLVGVGLSVHMALDSIDCQVTNGVWVH
jgi:hypothetical protein